MNMIINVPTSAKEEAMKYFDSKSVTLNARGISVIVVPDDEYIKRFGVESLKKAIAFDFSTLPY